MYVLQNCRGKSRNIVAERDNTTENTRTSPRKTSESEIKHDLGDYIIFHATIPGSNAYRTKDGSILVQNLCDSLRDYPDDILTHSVAVTKNISETTFTDKDGKEEDVQICEVTHTLRKRFFIPNLSGEDPSRNN